MLMGKSPRELDADWGWLPDTDSTASEDISIDGIGVLGIHLHQLIVNKPFYFDGQQKSIDAFRICVSAYALTRYSKTRRVYVSEKQEPVVRFDQTIQMLTRIYDKRRDKRHLIHVILYGYSNKDKRYALIDHQVIDSIKLVSARHISEAVIFESSTDICGKGTLLIELIFVYGRHGYNYSSQLVFQNDVHLSNTIKHLTLFERIHSTDDSNRETNGLYKPPETDLPLFLKLSFDELYQVHENPIKCSRIIKALSTSPKYSSISAIIEMQVSRKQRLQTLFNFVTEDPCLPEQNILEPTASCLLPWSIAYWKRALSGLPLHGSNLDFNDSQADSTHLANTSPVLRQVIDREEHYVSLTNNTTNLEMLKARVHRVIHRFFELLRQ
ncbi:unnamed protein product [Adineta ricciae]|uniref:Uncharacterized protein n=1 Tax=Adineta ricciae TaxID=249248 RepID=A0A814TC10_ADIRI|nr:unnamed protein product [Adineta ricciae]